MQEDNKIKKDISLSRFSTFKIGGQAKFYIEIKTKNDLKFALKFAKKTKKKLYVLGGGSNILINSKRINGIVARFCNNNIKIYKNGLICDAGVTLLNALSVAIKHGFSGLEWSHGIPRATIGGSIINNSGAFGTSMADIIERVEVFNVKNNKFINLDNKSCKFSYKDSIFKQNKNYLIWKVTLKMKDINPKIILKTSKKYLQTRLKTQSHYFNIGCIFKNIPIKQIKKENPKLIKKFKINNNLSAGLVIDSLGLKGKTIGGARISNKHANFIENFNNANSDDVVYLIKKIKKEVKKEYKINLEEEIYFF